MSVGITDGRLHSLLLSSICHRRNTRVCTVPSQCPCCCCYRRRHVRSANQTIRLCVVHAREVVLGRPRTRCAPRQSFVSARVKVQSCDTPAHFSNDRLRLLGNRCRPAPLLCRNHCVQVCEDLLEKMVNQKGSDKKLELLTPFMSGLGKESAFPLVRLILPEVQQYNSKVAPEAVL